MLNNNEHDRLLTNRETEPQRHTLGIFADDEPRFAQEYASCFDGLRLFTPIIVTSRVPLEVSEQLKNVPLNNVGFVITDQHFVDPDLRNEMSKFISNLREVNSTAWIIETGGWAVEQVFKGSNRVVPRYDMSSILKYLRTAPPTTQAKINALKVWSTEAFREASKFSDTSTTGDLDLQRRNSLSKAVNNHRFTELLNMLDIEYGDFYTRVSNASGEILPEIIHTLWSIIGHLELGNEEGFFSLPLRRLHSLLEGKKFGM